MRRPLTLLTLCGLLAWGMTATAANPSDDAAAVAATEPVALAQADYAGDQLAMADNEDEEEVEKEEQREGDREDAEARDDKEADQADEAAESAAPDAGNRLPQTAVARANCDNCCGSSARPTEAGNEEETRELREKIRQRMSEMGVPGNPENCADSVPDLGRLGRRAWAATRTVKAAGRRAKAAAGVANRVPEDRRAKACGADRMREARRAKACGADRMREVRRREGQGNRGEAGPGRPGRPGLRGPAGRPEGPPLPPRWTGPTPGRRPGGPAGPGAGPMAGGPGWQPPVQELRQLRNEIRGLREAIEGLTEQLKDAQSISQRRVTTGSTVDHGAGSSPRGRGPAWFLCGPRTAPMSAGDLPCLAIDGPPGLLGLSVLVCEFCLVRVPFDDSDPSPILQELTCIPRDAAAGCLATRPHRS